MLSEMHPASSVSAHSSRSRQAVSFLEAGLQPRSFGKRALATAFLPKITCPEVVHGGALPTKNYPSDTLGGKDVAPGFSMLMGPELRDYDPKALILVARDSDAQPVRTSDGIAHPAPPLWVVANVAYNPTDPTVIGQTTGIQVVPYQGPRVADDFVHRIFFSVYVRNNLVPEQFVQSWTGPYGLEHYMERHHFSKNVDNRADFMMTAVQHFPPGGGGGGTPLPTNAAGTKRVVKPWFKFW